MNEEFMIPDDVILAEQQYNPWDYFDSYVDFRKYEIAQKLKSKSCKLQESDKAFLYRLLTGVALEKSITKVGHPNTNRADLSMAEEFISWLLLGRNSLELKNELKAKTRALSDEGFYRALTRGLDALIQECEKKLASKQTEPDDNFFNDRVYLKKVLAEAKKYKSERKKHGHRKT